MTISFETFIIRYHFYRNAISIYLIFIGFLAEENCTLSTSEESEETTANENATDASSVVRNRRIAFFENRQEQTDVQIQNQCLKDLISESTSSGESETQPASEGNIRIRLKYLNDDQKLVEGRLQEQLGDFKKYV